jgi:hypothetical protein
MGQIMRKYSEISDSLKREVSSDFTWNLSWEYALLCENTEKDGC